MGNSNVKYVPVELKFATYNEMDNLFLEKYIGSGYTQEDAIISLTQICINNGIPTPEKINSQYCCGTVKIMQTFKEVTKYNTVFFRERNGRQFAIIFYSRIC